MWLNCERVRGDACVNGGSGDWCAGSGKGNVDWRLGSGCVVGSWLEEVWGFCGCSRGWLGSLSGLHGFGWCDDGLLCWLSGLRGLGWCDDELLRRLLPLRRLYDGAVGDRSERSSLTFPLLRLNLLILLLLPLLPARGFPPVSRISLPRFAFGDSFREFMGSDGSLVVVELDGQRGQVESGEELADFGIGC